MAQSCLTLCSPIDCSLPCSSVHWIFQARVLEWVAISFSTWELCTFLLTAIDFFREGNDTPLHYSCLENPMDGGAWWTAVHGVAKSQTRLSDFTFTFHFHALKKELATHSSVLAWRIPGTGKTGGLPSMGSHRVGHDWSDLAAAALISYCFSSWFFLMILFYISFSYHLPLFLIWRY